MPTLIRKRPNGRLENLTARGGTIGLSGGRRISYESLAAWPEDQLATESIYIAPDVSVPDGQILASVDYQWTGTAVKTVATFSPLPSPVCPFADFLDRLTDEEYAALQKARSYISQGEQIGVMRAFDKLMIAGTIAVENDTAQKFKTGLVALNVLTKDRADEIFVS